MTTLLTELRQVPIVPAARTPQRPPAPAPPRLRITRALAERPALLRAELDELLDRGLRTIEVDVSALPVLPALALRSLVDVDSALRCRGGRLHVIGATPRTVRVMAASRTLRLMGTGGG